DDRHQDALGQGLDPGDVGLGPEILDLLDDDVGELDRVAVRIGQIFVRFDKTQALPRRRASKTKVKVVEGPDLTIANQDDRLHQCTSVCARSAGWNTVKKTASDLCPTHRNCKGPGPLG